jgi:hypothetical protein
LYIQVTCWFGGFKGGGGAYHLFVLRTVHADPWDQRILSKDRESIHDKVLFIKLIFVKQQVADRLFNFIR